MRAFGNFIAKILQAAPQLVVVWSPIMTRFILLFCLSMRVSEHRNKNKFEVKFPSLLYGQFTTNQRVCCYNRTTKVVFSQNRDSCPLKWIALFWNVIVSFLLLSPLPWTQVLICPGHRQSRKLFQLCLVVEEGSLCLNSVPHLCMFLGRSLCERRPFILSFQVQ